MKRRLVAALAALTALVAVSACSASTSDTAHQKSGTITVAAAASLTGTFDTLKSQFEKRDPGTTIKLDFGGSPRLATQIDQGAPIDVFASASTTNMDTVVAAGDAAKPETFVKNTAEIAVAPGNPKHISALSDLAKPGLKVALCDANVPCGVVAGKVLANAHVNVSPAARQSDVKATLSLVSTGEVDAAIVYVTDVRAAGSAVTGVPIPAAQNTSTEYPIAVCTHTTNRALAQAFVEFVLSPDGRDVLTAAGFASP